MPNLKRFYGLIAIAAVVILAYPAFTLGRYLGDKSATLLQEIAEHPVSGAASFALNAAGGWLLYRCSCFGRNDKRSHHGPTPQTGRKG